MKPRGWVSFCDHARGPNTKPTHMLARRASLRYLAYSERRAISATPLRASSKLPVFISCFSWRYRRRQAHSFCICNPFSTFQSLLTLLDSFAHLISSANGVRRCIRFFVSILEACDRYMASIIRVSLLHSHHSHPVQTQGLPQEATVGLANVDQHPQLGR
jgi:hypothetical protein